MRKPRMITATEGLEGSGKSDWALRNTPRPAVYLNFDFGVEGIGGVDNAKLIEGVTFHDFTPFGQSGYIRDEVEDQRRARSEMDRFLGTWRQEIKDEVPLIVCDTFTAAWAAQRIARSDDTYMRLEAEFHGLVRAAYLSEKTSLILIHHLKKDWARSDGKPFPTGTYSRDGLDSVGTMVQLGIRQSFTPPHIVNGTVMEKAKFEYMIWKSRDNIGMTGMKGKIVDWPTLCTMVCPSVDWAGLVKR